MRKTPSYLKGLAETRARAARDVQCYQQLVDELQTRLAQAQAELAACDTLIRKFDDRLDPDLIDPVNHWQGRYGKRGALKAAILKVLQAHAPEEVTTTMIGLAVQAEFRLVFHLPVEREAWIANSVRNCLKKLVKEGLVEACHDQSNTGFVGSWRLFLKELEGKC